MAVNKKNIMTRYFFVILIMGLVGVAIVVKAGITMLAGCSRPFCKGECNRKAEPG